MKKNKSYSIVAVVGLLAGLPLLAVPPFEGSIRVTKAQKAQWPALAKVSMEKALSAVKGKPLSVKLDEERGFLVYEISVIDDRGQETEFGVDAGNGKVLWSQLDD